MYYATITVSTKPGMRFQGIDHLKKFADWFKGKYNIETQILGNMSGRIYRNHVVFRYESLAQMETTTEKMLADDFANSSWINPANLAKQGLFFQVSCRVARLFAPIL